MNYKEARDYLDKVSIYGSVLGLDSIKRLLKKIGNPEKELRVVHIAGTNGKGSTGAFIQNILMKSGYKVGRYSSPAVFEYREIIKINDDFIEKSAVAEIITLIKEKCDELTNEGFSHPTPFEIETAMSFEYFKRNNCDIVLVECGMGGATDATNVFDRVLCSVITPISLDHTGFLGETLSEIAEVKSGIIKKKCNVVTAIQPKECLKVIEKNAGEKEANLTVCSVAESVKAEGLKTRVRYISGTKSYDFTLNMMGTYQVINAITAIEVCHVLESQGFEVEENIEKGLLKTVWPGRMEVIDNNPLFIIDGAHNPGAIEELKKTLDFYFTNERITFIMGVLADKDFEKEIRMIADRATKIITVTPNNKRALDGEKLSIAIKPYNGNVSYAKSIEDGAKQAINTVEEGKSDMILAFGSLSYLAEIKQTVKAERRD